MENTPRSILPRRRGMALMLVMIVLAITVVVGAVFLNAATTTTSLARHVDESVRARLIAEAGLDIALTYVQKDPAWRTNRPNGVWAADQPLAGGSYSISCQDGTSITDDGLVLGDGNLADDSSEPVVFTVAGRFGSATTLVRAVATPRGNSALAVSDRVEMRKQSKIDSYYSTAGPYGPSNRGSAAVVSSNQAGTPAITVSERGRISGNLWIGPKGAPSDGVKVFDQGSISGSISALSSPRALPINIPPSMALSSGPASYTTGKQKLSGNYHFDSLDVLGTAILDVRGQATILVDGDVHIGEQAVVKMGGAIAYAAGVRNTLDVLDGGVVDSYNSAEGPYGLGNSGSSAVIATNSTASPAVRVNGLGTVKGDVYVGVNADPATGISVSSGTITGARDKLKTAIAIPAAAPAPTNVNANQGSLSISGPGTTVIASNIQVDDFTISSSGVVQISGHRTIRVNKSFTVTNLARLEILANSSLKIYVTEQISFSSTAKVNANTRNPSLLVIYGRGTGTTHQITDLAEVHAVMDAPTGVVSIANSGSFYGALVADRAEVKNAGKFHHDQNPAIATANPRLPLAYPSGKLSIYACGIVTVDATAQVNAGATDDPAAVEFLQLGDAPVTITGDSIVKANVTAPETDGIVSGNAIYTGKMRLATLMLGDRAVLNTDGSGGNSAPGILADYAVEVTGQAVLNGVGSASVVVNRSGRAVFYMKDYARIEGDAYGGVKGDPDEDVRLDDNAVITGKISNLTKGVDISLPERWSLGPATSRQYTGGSVTVLSSNLNCVDLTVQDDATLEIDGAVTINVQGNLSFKNNAKIVLRPRARLTISFGKRSEFTDSIRLNVNGDPARFSLHHYGTEKFDLRKDSGLCATVIAPLAEFKIKERAHLYGSFKGKRLKIEGDGQAHFDASGRPVVRWIEQ